MDQPDTSLAPLWSGLPPIAAICGVEGPLLICGLRGTPEECLLGVDPLGEGSPNDFPILEGDSAAKDVASRPGEILPGDSLDGLRCICWS
jgi:hypothetical protein